MGRNSSGGSRSGGGFPSGGSSSSGRISSGRSQSINSAGRQGRTSAPSSAPRQSAPSGPSYNSGPHHMPGGPRPPMGGGMHHHPRPHRHFWGPRPRHYYGGGGYGYRGHVGCGSYLITLIVLLVIVAIVAFNRYDRNPASYNSAPNYPQQNSGNQSVNTKVDTSDFNDYCKDTLGWIEDKGTFLSGLKTFYNKTGVKPFLYLTNNINGSNTPTQDELDDFANKLYDELFTDENHYLLIFMEYGDTYMLQYVCGSDAASVIGTDGAETVLDYVDQYYTSSMEDEEYFSTVFSSAANKIKK